MGRPQDNRLQRSGNTPLDPDHIETEVSTEPHAPRDEPGGGPVPPENRPGHQPAEDQDKPDLDAFAERFGVASDDEPEADAQPESESEATPEPERESSPVSHLMAAASTARDLAQPVAQVLQSGVHRATELIEQRSPLAARVERLETEVAELRGRLDALGD